MRDSYFINLTGKPSEIQSTIAEINFVLNDLATRIDALDGSVGSPVFLTDVDANQHKVKNLFDPSNPQDAVNLRTLKRLLPVPVQSGRSSSAGSVFNAASPPTAKGGLIVGAGNNVYGNLAVGPDTTVPQADSTQPLGVKWAAAPVSVHNILSASHGDVLAAAVLRGALIVGNSTPLWSLLALGPLGTFPRSNGTDLVNSRILTVDLPTLFNVTPVTANANSVAAQNLQSVALAASQLNTVGATLIVFGAGTWTTPALQTPTVTITVTLGGVSVFSITSQPTLAASTGGWNLNIGLTTSTTGAAGTLEVHGNLIINDTSVAAGASVYPDTAGASGAVDLTGALTLQVTVTFSTQPAAAPFNSATERILVAR